MLQIIKKISVGAIILLFFPLIIYFSNWKWTPNNFFLFKKYIYWITITGNYPWGVILSFITFLYFFWMMNIYIKNLKIFLVITSFIIFFGQISKEIIKNFLKIQRPIVNWIFNNILFIKDFYFFPKEIKKKIIEIIFEKYEKIPIWLKIYWGNESGFSFPSGHTIFVSTWALLSIILLWPKHIKILTLIMIWAECVMLSRIALGMHFPEDLLAGVFISWILIILIIFLIKYFFKIFFLKIK
ncbi:phosphatase PAP2 family protein [Sodalis-like secondary symbiont of Drepanosiphum platanoidis]|uniref:phosphatase PAP2 family protein n=1 Tax=Sodalis-like secondary symbiont of Drepanosiphum platanoidis TaxID=2994493 RepID=UPI003463BFF8